MGLINYNYFLLHVKGFLGFPRKSVLYFYTMKEFRMPTRGHLLYNIVSIKTNRVRCKTQLYTLEIYVRNNL